MQERRDERIEGCRKAGGGGQERAMKERRDAGKGIFKRIRQCCGSGAGVGDSQSPNRQAEPVEPKLFETWSRKRNYLYIYIITAVSLDFEGC